jgi:hypothetical protein
VTFDKEMFFKSWFPMRNKDLGFLLIQPKFSFEWWGDSRKLYNSIYCVIHIK